MPENKKTRRAVAVPARSGQYNNALQVQGRPDNVTMQFLRDIGHDQTGIQELYQHALNDIPDPLNPGKTLTYGQVLADMRTPAGVQRAEAFGRAQGLNRTMQPQEFAQAQFDAARGRLIARAAQNPGTLAFAPEAVEAFVAPRRAAMQADPNYTAPAGQGQMVDAASLRQFFAAQPVADGTARTAPGAPLRRPIQIR